MKAETVLFLALFALCTASPISLKNSSLISEELVRSFKRDFENAKPRDVSAVLNEYADKVFENIQNFIIKSGMDPFELPEIHEGFEFVDKYYTVHQNFLLFLFLTLIIHYHGELDMTSGWLNDVSTIHRGGDVEVVYDGTQLYVTVPIAFDDLSLTYDYSAKLMNLGPTGTVEGKIKDLSVKVIIGFDFEYFFATLNDFEIVNSGHVDLNFSGNVLTDWLLNILLDVATAALKPIILGVMESIVKNPIESVIDLVNSIIDSILYPTTTTTEIIDKVWLMK